MSKNIIKIYAPAKINLTLNVTGKREDGYHLLHSLTCFSDFGDEVIIEPHPTFKFSMQSDIDDVPTDENNLSVQAAQKLSGMTNKPLNCHIHLDKNIPMGAGLGGGSSDAASTVKALLKFWNIGLDKDTLNNLLLSLGADVPVCYYTKPCFFSGIGEIIEPVNALPNMHLVLIYPNISTSTPAVFQNLNIQNYSSINNHAITLDDIKIGKNDLTDAAIKTTPIIKDVLEEILKTNDCIISRMTGSGSCCFGIYETKAQADKAAQAIQKERPDWWVRPVSIL